MNKIDLIKKLQDEMDLPRPYMREVVNVFFDEMAKSLERGDRVEIRGLCSFFVKEYEPYIGRNPKTKEKVQIAGKRLPFFKCGKELKERVNKR